MAKTTPNGVLRVILATSLGPWGRPSYPLGTKGVAQWWFKPVPTTCSGSVGYNIKFTQSLSTPTYRFGSICVRVQLSSPMAIYLIGVSKMDDQTAIQEAVSVALKSMDHLICVLSHQAGPQSLDYREITDFTVSKFKWVNSILKRTGHTQFHRGPSYPVRQEIQSQPQTAHWWSFGHPLGHQV